MQADFNDWLSLVDHLKIKAFPELTLASSLREGVNHLESIRQFVSEKFITQWCKFLEQEVREKCRVFVAPPCTFPLSLLCTIFKFKSINLHS